MPPDSVTEKITYSWSGHYWLVSLTVLLIVGGVGLGCDRKPDKGGKTSKQKKQQVRDKPTEAQAGAAQKTTDKWQRRQLDRLSGSMKEKLKKAKQAQQKMGRQLKGELTDSIANKSFPETVEFCKSTAPEIAKNVGESLGVSMGRTSHRLRNPNNKPPEWASSAVAQKQRDIHVFRGPENELGYLHPIEMKGHCVNCHGSKKQLADGVPDMLAEHYPEDEATGFSVGDLRGWFWVKVPAEGS